MRLPVFLGLLVLLALQAFAEIRISQPELVPLDPALLQAGDPDVAAGDGFLLAWREGYFGPWPGPLRLRTYDGEGRPRQFNSVTLETGKTPHAFWNGREFVLVYALEISRFGSPVPIPAIVSVRIRPDGTIVEGSHTVLASSHYSSSVYDVSWNGSAAAAVVYFENASHLLELDAGGNLLRDTRLDFVAAGVAAKSSGEFLVLPFERGDAIAEGDGGFAVLDHTSDGVLTAIRLDANGAEVERFVLAKSAGFSTAIQWDGRKWIALYPKGDALCTAQFTRASDLSATCDGPAETYDPSFAIGSLGPLRAWTVKAQVFTDGGLASTAWSASWGVSAAVDETGVLAAWVEGEAEGRRLHVGGVRNDGSLRPERTLGDFVDQNYPVLSRSDSGTLLAWRDRRSNGTKVMLLGPDGAPRSEEVEVTPLAYHTPAVAARGGEWVAAWLSSGGGIRSVRLTSTLAITDEQDFSGSAAQEAPAIAATATGYLVVWREVEGTHARIVAEPLDANGRRTTGGNRLIDGEVAVGNPVVGCRGDSCLLAWFTMDSLSVTLVGADGSRRSADRTAPMGNRLSRGLLVEALPDGSFRVYRGDLMTPVSASGEPGPSRTWHADDPTIGSAVTWRGNSALVYTRPTSEGTQVFVHELVPRTRAVRH